MKNPDYSMRFSSHTDSMIPIISSTIELGRNSRITNAKEWTSASIDFSVSSQFGAFKFASSNKDFYAINDFEVKALKASKKIISLLNNDDFIDGIYTKTELYLEKLHQEDINLFKESFQKAWLELYALSPELIGNFIKIAASIEYDWLGDRADALALAGCSHRETMVNEAALRAIESWSQKKHLDYLHNVRQFNIPWLDRYKEQVTNYLSGIQ